MDLIKRKFELKKKAQVTVKNYEDVVDFVFADVNNNICLRVKDSRFKFFNSEEELNKILRDLGYFLSLSFSHNFGYLVKTVNINKLFCKHAKKCSSDRQVSLMKS